MERDYIGNLRAIAGVNHSSISEQDLQLLCIKYNLTDDEETEMRRYCNENMITVYEIKSDTMKDSPKEEKTTVPKPEPEPSVDHIVTTRKIVCKHVRKISRSIMSIASNRTRKIAKGKGWVCGTCASKRRNYLSIHILREFSNEEIKFIYEHLSDITDDQEFFDLKDETEQEKCDELTNRLNSIIPKLHINWFPTAFFDE